MKSEKRLAMGVAMALVLAVSSGSAGADCRPVNGHVTSQQVTQFSTGDLCPSPVGICTEGRFIGGLKGHFTFSVESATPAAVLDPALGLDPSVFVTTGILFLDADCGGELVLKDVSAISLDDGQFGGLENIDGGASTGSCAGASGRLRLSGVFVNGCVNCDYRGEICLNND